MNGTDKPESRPGVFRRALLPSVALFIGVAVSLVLAEVLVVLVSPQSYMYPRLQPSVRYGHKLPANTQMVESLPGSWRFVYTINEYGYRGEPRPVSNRYDTPNVVVLGDSYSFGEGVSDDEVYSSVLQREVGADLTIVNISVTGYGLTQQIRWYYEFGQVYQPAVVVLQFSSNDPLDNFYDPVTRVEQGRFVFENSKRSLTWPRKMLRQSAIQYSQLYNLLRIAVYSRVRRHDIEGILGAPVDSARNRVEETYVELLAALLEDLGNDGVRVIFLPVNGHLQQFPAIERAVRRFDAEGALRLTDPDNWFSLSESVVSPEGHEWGAEAHRMIGSQLPRVIKESGSSDAGESTAGVGNDVER